MINPVSYIKEPDIGTNRVSVSGTKTGTNILFLTQKYIYNVLIISKLRLFNAPFALYIKTSKQH